MTGPVLPNPLDLIPDPAVIRRDLADANRRAAILRKLLKVAEEKRQLEGLNAANDAAIRDREAARHAG